MCPPIVPRRPTLHLGINSLLQGNRPDRQNLGPSLHRRLGVVSPPRAVLVTTQGLEKVILALSGEPRDIVHTLKIRLMTEVATVLLRKRPRSLRARGIWSVRDRIGRRQF